MLLFKNQVTTKSLLILRSTQYTMSLLLGDYFFSTIEKNNFFFKYSSYYSDTY